MFKNKFLYLKIIDILQEFLLRPKILHVAWSLDRFVQLSPSWIQIYQTAFDVLPISHKHTVLWCDIYTLSHWANTPSKCNNFSFMLNSSSPRTLFLIYVIFPAESSIRDRFGRRAAVTQSIFICTQRIQKQKPFTEISIDLWPVKCDSVTAVSPPSLDRALMVKWTTSDDTFAFALMKKAGGN